MRKKIICCGLLFAILLTLFCSCELNNNDGSLPQSPEHEKQQSVYSYQAQNPTPISFKDFVLLSEEKSNMPSLEDVLTIDKNAVILGDVLPNDGLNVPYAISENRTWLGYDGVVTYSGDQVCAISFTVPNVTYRDFALVVEQLEDLSESSFEFEDWSDGIQKDANIKFSEWENKDEVIREESIKLSSNFLHNEVVPGYTGEFRVVLTGKDHFGDWSFNLFQWHKKEIIYNELKVTYGYPVL